MRVMMTGSPLRVADLPNPFFIAHRGMANVYPENSLEAYRGSAAFGVDVVEADCWLTRDQGLVCLHDTTLDRTTTGTGDSHELTLPGASTLRIDASSWFAAAWADALRVPTFTDVLNELAGRVVLCPEAKSTGAGQAIVERLAHYGLSNAAIVQSFIEAELRPALAQGLPAMMLTATSSYDPRRLRQRGVRYLGLCAVLPTSLAALATASGLQVVVWTVDRRVELEPWLTAGAVGFFSNDPLYVSGRSPVLGSDPYGQSTYYYGHLANAVAGDRGTFDPPGAWGFADTSPQYKGVLQGWACPIGAAAAGDPYAITFTVHSDSAASNGWVGAFVCAADDRSFDDAAEYRAGLCGYHVVLHQAGLLEISIVRDGIGEPAASTPTSPVGPGDSAMLRVDVNDNHIAASRIDTEPAASVAVVDATYRGGYIHLGRRAAAVRFSSVTVG
jgi:glycerophosphoryl diester phosphodiesterase